MHIRPMYGYDLRPVSKLAALAWADDERFLMTNPRGKEYPEDYRKSFLRRLQVRVRSPGFHGFVCVADWRDSDWLPGELTEDAPENEEILLGYSLWQRTGPADDPLVRPWFQKNTSLFAQFDRYLQSWEHSYINFFKLDRSLDHALDRQYVENIAKFLPFKDIPSQLTLRALATHPAAQRRGVGRVLMRWGMEQAQAEQIPITLHASSDGMRLYQILGFKTVAWKVFETGDLYHSHASMIWDWQGTYTREARPEEATAGRHKVEVVWRDEP